MDKYTAEHTLELSGAYDAHSLKAAYHALAAKYHPDAAERHGFTKEEATSKMQDINEANDFLAKYVVSPTGTTICDESPIGSYAGPKPKADESASTTSQDASRPFNPFEGHRPGATDRRYRQRTAQYYWSDPRYQTSAQNARHRAEQRQEGEEPRYYNGEYESFSQKPQPEPKEDPTHPFPKWYLPVWRFFAIFPYRFVFLFAICLLVNFTDPLGASARLGFVSFEDTLILLAVINLIRPFLTSPIRSGMLWLVDRARDAAWAIRGSRAHS